MKPKYRLGEKVFYGLDVYIVFGILEVIHRYPRYYLFREGETNRDADYAKKISENDNKLRMYSGLVEIEIKRARETLEKYE